MTSDGFNSYAWNARNQLASMNFNADSFQYDGYGRRMGKTISGAATNYLYDGANVAQELSGTTVTANLMSGGIDEVFTRTDSSGTAHFLADALGSTLALTDGSGGALASYAYEPFGNTTLASGSSVNSYQYTGRENDGTGLYFYRARYYNPSLQRFVSEDPIGLTAGPNLYAYGLNSPVDLNDPSGLWTGQLGISGSVTVFGVTFVGSVGVAVDGQGNIGTYSTSGAMLGPGANASVGVSAAYSNGQDITALRGPFGNISASGGDVASGTVDAFSGPGNGPGGVVTGAGVTGGLGFGGAASAGVTTTTVTPRFGPLAPSPGGSCDTSGGCGGGGGGGFGPNPGGSGNGGSGSTAGRKR